MGRESSGHDRGGARSQSRLRHRPRQNDADHRRRRNLGGLILPQESMTPVGRARGSTSRTATAFTSIPSTPNGVFITYTDIGLFRSEDGGASWTSSTAGVPRDWVNTTYWIVFDPKVARPYVERKQLYARSAPSQDVATQSVLNYKGGVCRSDDGGKNWTQSNSGMDETGATHILLDPNSSVDARVLYVAGFRTRVSIRAPMVVARGV